MAGTTVGGAGLGHGKGSHEIGEGGFIDHRGIGDHPAVVAVAVRLHEPGLHDGNPGGGRDGGTVKDHPVVIAPVDVIQEVLDMGGAGRLIEDGVDIPEVGPEADCGGGIRITKVRREVVADPAGGGSEEEKIRNR